MKELDKVLDKNEKILWEGGPDFWPFFVGRTLVVTIFGCFWMVFMFFFFLMSYNAPGMFKYMIFFTPHFWLGIGLVFGPAIYNFLVFKRTYYCITHKRVIIQKGVIG